MCLKPQNLVRQPNLMKLVVRYWVKMTVIAAATRVGILYYLGCQAKQQVNAAQCKEVLWHQWYGHLGTESSEASSRQAS